MKLPFSNRQPHGQRAPIWDRPVRNDAANATPPNRTRWVPSVERGIHSAAAHALFGVSHPVCGSEKGARLCRRPAAARGQLLDLTENNGLLRLVEDDTAALRDFQTGLGSFGCAGGMNSAFRWPVSASRKAGFTMVEIALCLAIVGFALVAIIGVLPAGLNVQKENREETIINQEATVWMDALRSGSFGYDELADYVDRVVVSSQNFDTNGGPMNTVITVAERNTPSQGDNRIAFGNSGSLIVGLLSTPRIGEPTPGVTGAAYSTNFVYAYVRALSGSAAEKAPQDNPDVRDLAFSYRMVVDTTKAGSYDPAFLLTNRVDGVLGRNLADVRLLFRWPLKQPITPASPLDRPEAGTGRLAYRTQLSGDLLRIDDNKQFPGIAFYFLQPRNYTR